MSIEKLREDIFVRHSAKLHVEFMKWHFRVRIFAKIGFMRSLNNHKNTKLTVYPTGLRFPYWKY